MVAAKTGTFSAAVSVHGAAHTLEDVSEARAGTLFITVPKDDYYPEAMHEEHRRLGAVVEVVEGGYHGFVVRGDFATNPDLRALAEKALVDATEFCKQHTMRY
jgi:dienelactone hydrolase